MVEGAIGDHHAVSQVWNSDGDPCCTGCRWSRYYRWHVHSASHHSRTGRFDKDFETEKEYMAEYPAGWLTPSGGKIGWGVSFTTATDANTGSVLWVKPVSMTYVNEVAIEEDGDMKVTVPTCQGGKVFTLCEDGKMGCVYNARSGSLYSKYEAFASTSSKNRTDTNILFDGAYAYAHNGGSDVYKYYVSP